MSAEQKPLHIVELKAENVKRLRAVSVRPDGAVVVIGGRNAQGKSSLLDAIEMALGGAKSIPLEPVRHGARKARIVADLGELVVERTFTAKGTELVVRGKDGEPKASPQKLLDSLCAKVTFDPFEFARMEPKKQDELLKRLLGLDFSDVEAARAKLYGQRTDAGKEVKRLEALLDEAPFHPGVPKEPIDLTEIRARVQARVDEGIARERAAGRIESARAALGRHDEDIARQEREIARLREDLEHAETTLRGMQTAGEERLAAILEAEQALAPEVRVEDVHAELDAAQATNAKVKANAERDKLEKELRKFEAAIQGYTDTIASLDEEKASRLAEAKFPIPGLGFDDSGPTLDGVPLAQASSAQKLRVSVAIGAALNPRVKIMLVREGSLLDDDSMALLAELARETGSQVWVERVGTKDASAVIIEDGAVLEGSGEVAAE